MDKIIEIIFKVWKSLFNFFRFKTKEFLLFVILCMVIYYLIVVGFKCEFGKDKFKIEVEKKSIESKIEKK